MAFESFIATWALGAILKPNIWHPTVVKVRFSATLAYCQL